MFRQGRVIAALTDWLRVKVSWAYLRIKLRLLGLSGKGYLLVFHPQNLGFQRTIRLLNGWHGRVFLFGLDNSFFCVRSYNYIPGEHRPCLRCIDNGLSSAKTHACDPFPVKDDYAFSYVDALYALLRDNQVTILAQNERNAELYRRFGGNRALVIGLWTSDWTDAFERKIEPTQIKKGYDVVFHSHYVAAKGADWMLEVARHLPRVTFLFPTSLPIDRGTAPDNIDFRPMTWDTGLADEVIRAAIVCVPSLWSATIEGALIKSILYGKGVARIDVPSAYGDELPDGLVLNLDADPETAAKQLGHAVATQWQPDLELFQRWRETFVEENFDMFNKIIRRINQTIRRKMNRGDDRAPVPFEEHGIQLEKLGTAYGGWTVPVETIKQDWICYCVGAGEDISFDCNLIERFDNDVYVFDPTPRAIRHVEELNNKIAQGEQMPINNRSDVLYTLPADKLHKLHFYPWGVWSEDITQKFYSPKDSAHVSHSIVNLQKTEEYFEADCRTLTNIMLELGHEHIDLLKLDVEGAEYQILDSMLTSGITPKVLCIEFDEGNLPLDDGAPNRIRNMIRRLQNAGFQFINQDGWNTIFVYSA